MTTTTTMPFSQQLRTATDEAHQAAERSDFVVDLVGGQLPLSDLARYGAQLHAVYSVLEDAVASADDPALVPFLAPELARVPALADDLEHLAGPGWADECEQLPATIAYCDRVRAASEGSSGGLLAHHYVRYLGDLSGGQFLGRAIARVYELEDGRGTSFYRFEQIPSPKAFKDRYRAALDALPWDADERARVVDEANAAFACNTAIFHELSASRTSR